MLGRLVGAIRRNHALEHATVSLLLARLGPDLRLVGRAAPDGFYLYGNVPTDLVRQCAGEGLARLQRGEAFWAVTPLCGTNLATAGVLAGLSSLAIAGSGDRKDRLPTVLMAAVTSVILAQPVGRWIQANLTTDADLAGVDIVGVEARGRGNVHKVKTRRAAQAA
jgi:hypothetical protein